MANYEDNEGDFVPMTSIIEEARMDRYEDLNITERQVGVAIGSIWGDKVKKVCSSSNIGSGYRNLRKRPVFEEDTAIIHTLDEYTVKKLKLLSSKKEGWILELSSIDKFTLLKAPFSQSGLTVDGRRLMYEITGNTSQSNITIRTHGQTITGRIWSFCSIPFIHLKQLFV